MGASCLYCGIMSALRDIICKRKREREGGKEGKKERGISKDIARSRSCILTCARFDCFVGSFSVGKCALNCRLRVTDRASLANFERPKTGRNRLTATIWTDTGTQATRKKDKQPRQQIYRKRDRQREREKATARAAKREEALRLPKEKKTKNRRKAITK